MGDMDKLCMVVVVAGAIVLLCIGYGEVSRVRAYSPSDLGTCGMRAKAETVSAKRAASLAEGARPDVPNGQYVTLGEEWPNEADEKNKHVEMKQDEEALSSEFTWEASVEDAQKFDTLRVDPEKVKKLANTKAVSPETQGEKPTYSRRLGLANPLVDLYHGRRDTVKFGEGCSWFGGTDAYYAAREEKSQCDCLTERCEPSAKA